ncbi:MAG: fucose isomerase [Clostridia bacterium]|nr:fucose isomerase [Clostridia bacterium]
MLKGIPNILSPELLKVLMEMGHGDTLMIGDGNYPHASNSKDCVLTRMDGHGVVEILDAILTLMPLDTYVDAPVTLMELTPSDVGKIECPIWDEIKAVVEKHQPGTKSSHMERFAFYEKAKKSYCIVATGETAVYANVLLQKGVVK